jgi:O-antigen ligase
VQRKEFETAKIVLTSEYWLLFALSAMFFCFFALDTGADFFVGICGFLLLTELLLGNYRIKNIPFGHALTAVICAYLLLVSVLIPFGHPDFDFMKRLTRMLGIVFAMHCLSLKKVDNRISFLFSAVLVLSICWQFTAVYLFGKPYGTHSNPHRLATFATLALPFILYFICANTGWYRFIFIPVGILDGILFLKSGSLPAYLAIFIGTFFVFFFMIQGWKKWLGTIIIFTILAVLYVVDFPIPKWTGGTIGMKSFIAELPNEERVQFWLDAWKMLKDNSLAAWIVGNGIGSIQVSFPKYLFPGYISIHPHNYFLEVLHENGIVGFVLIFGGLGYLMFMITKMARKTRNKRYSIFLWCIIAAFLIWFILCGLNFPVYTTYTTYPLGFILGTMLVIVARIPHDELLQQESQG